MCVLMIQIIINQVMAGNGDVVATSRSCEPEKSFMYRFETDYFYSKYGQ